jgi:hypothetical protein
LFLAFPLWAVDPTNRPNVILISLDTVRPDHLGCYGYSKPTSPNLDRFAREGVLFRNARSQAPWTLPSHMSLFTSMLPSHNGVEDINKVLPAEIPTLAEILRKQGYQTAALVNNGQMMAHWGFSRGFDLWREFKVDTTEGNCESIRGEAQRWLAKAPKKPFFLFLHFFDAHAPYNPPERFKKAFGSSLTGAEANDLAFQARFPGSEIKDPSQMKQLIGSYDGGIAWLDEEAGKLLEKIPPNTLVVIFSDHGEAFKEHGWMLHGATLYEEEIRCALMMRLPAKTQKVVDAPVMLLDVAPTILKLCRIDAPLNYEGTDLAPLLEDKPLARPIFAETRAVLEGRIAKMVLLASWKFHYSLFDGAKEIYRLPDEKNNLWNKEGTTRDTLFKGSIQDGLMQMVRSWMADEDYWIVYAHGKGEFEVTLSVAEGQFATFIPIAIQPERDSFSISEDGRTMNWMVYPGGRTKALYFQLLSPNVPVRIDLKKDAVKPPSLVYAGVKGTHPKELPFSFDLRGATSEPIIEKEFKPEKEGLYIRRYSREGTSSKRIRMEKLDEQTLEQLRSLGYVR